MSREVAIKSHNTKGMDNDASVPLADSAIAGGGPDTPSVMPGQDFMGQRLSGLLSRINDYEIYFRWLEGATGGEGEGKAQKDNRLDHQGTTAYINLVKLVTSLREAQEESTDEAGPDRISQAARKIFMEEYGVDIG